MIFSSFKKHIDSIYEPSLSKNLTIIVQLSSSRILYQDLKDVEENIFFQWVYNIFLRIEINILI